MSDGAQERRSSAADDFGIDAVRELLRIINQSDITELQIERGGSKLLIKRGLPSAAHLAMAPATNHVPALHATPEPYAPIGTAAMNQPAADAEPLAPGQAITAPMVGTFYAAPSPKDPPFVSEGDTIHPGDKVGIIEAMKMMNEIESEYAGRVVRVLVKSGQPVEFGQPLMVIEPL
jgi:acetyl-CoA carboxylase biotin carboxyl carrier protein